MQKTTLCDKEGAPIDSVRAGDGGRTDDNIFFPSLWCVLNKGVLMVVTSNVMVQWLMAGAVIVVLCVLGWTNAGSPMICPVSWGL